MKSERIKQLVEQCGFYVTEKNGQQLYSLIELVVADCIDKIETYRIPVGNSAAGEMACEWTYDALKEIRDDIREHFGIVK